MKTRKIFWRDAAYDYIKKHGPASAAQLIESVVQKNGRPFAFKGAVHTNEATQLLRVDKRFTGHKSMQTNSSDNTYRVLIWSVIEDEE